MAITLYSYKIIKLVTEGSVACMKGGGDFSLQEYAGGR